jgi:hypothetical protein
MKVRSTALTLGILCGLLVAGVALAQGLVDLSWFRIGSSGRRVEADNLTLDSSIGQSLAGTVQGGGVELQSGFVPGVAGPDHTLGIQSIQILVVQGDAAAYDLVLYSRPELATVFSFEVQSLPTGVTATFDPETISGSGTSRLTLQTSPATPVGKYSLTVTATGGEAELSKQIILIVAAEIHTQDAPLLFQR